MPKWGLTILFPFSLAQLKMGIEKTAATKLPGRNIIVTTARVFMEEESCCEDMAMSLLSRATSIERRLSF